MHISGKGTDPVPLVVNMVWWMGQRTLAVVSSVKRQIVRAKDIDADSVNQVVAVAAYNYSLPVKSILFAQRQRQISCNGDGEVQSAGDKGGFYGNGKLNMKIFGRDEGACD